MTPSKRSSSPQTHRPTPGTVFRRSGTANVASRYPPCSGLWRRPTSLEAVKESGLTYMLFETSAYHNEAYAMRELYKAGALGTLVYAEGEYFHYMDVPIDSFRGWRVGLPPQWYPTHSNAYYTCITGGSFTEVSCMGIPGQIAEFLPKNNRYQNPFATEIALFRTSEGGMARMGVSWDTPGHQGEMGRVRGPGQHDGMDYQGIADITGINLNKPPPQP